MDEICTFIHVHPCNLVPPIIIRCYPILGDGRHLQEAAHPEQQGEQPGVPDEQGGGGGLGQGT